MTYKTRTTLFFALVGAVLIAVYYYRGWEGAVTFLLGICISKFMAIVSSKPKLNES
jgi:hypothetical protein